MYKIESYTNDKKTKENRKKQFTVWIFFIHQACKLFCAIPLGIK